MSKAINTPAAGQLALTTGTTFAMWREYKDSGYATVIRKGYDNFEELMSFKGIFESQGWLVGVYDDTTGTKLYSTPEA